MRRIWIFTLFPEYFEPLVQCGVVGRFLQSQKEAGTLSLAFVNPREFAQNNYKSVDDYPFGGGPGMIMRADILERCLLESLHKAYESSLEQLKKENKLLVINVSPRGTKWQRESALWVAQQLVGSGEGALADNNLADNNKDLVFLCGRYEGIDERFIETYVDYEFSLGDFILSGGELAVLAILDSSLRLLPGVLGNDQSLRDESFENFLLEAPQYTRPRTSCGKEVPAVYLSGNHAEIEKFKLNKRIEITKRYRPDLYQSFLQKEEEQTMKKQVKQKQTGV